jgi:hypothetical protein
MENFKVMEDLSIIINFVDSLTKLGFPIKDVLVLIGGVGIGFGWNWIRPRKVSDKEKLLAEKAVNKIGTLPRSKAQDILKEISDNHISNSTKDEDVTLCNKPEETYKYFVERLSKAHTSIDVTHFGGRPYHENEPDYFKRIEYYQTLGAIIRGGKVKVRRIQLIRDLETLEWTKQVLKEFERSSFRLGCYVGDASDIPLLSLMVIDGEEVCLACTEKNFSFDQKSISIKNPIFTQMIQNYFDILWRNSLIVKERNINPDLLTEIEGKIQQQLV